MGVIYAVVVAVLVAVLGAGQPALSASGAWVTESAADGTAAAYVVLDNPTMYDVYVVSATSDAAGKVELRDGDKPATVITVASFGSATLAADGAFLQLSELKRPLKAGDTLTLTIETDGGVTLVTTAVVKAP